MRSLISNVISGHKKGTYIHAPEPCPHCGHKKHDEPCSDVLTSERMGKMQYGPDDIGKECGCMVGCK